MIRYTLRCDHGHEFESWFQSSAAYDQQARRKLVSCPSCGSVKVDKAIMAPQISHRRKDPAPPAATPSPAATAEPEVTAPAAHSTSTPLLLAQERELRSKLKELRDHITKNAENVGQKFPNEARKMHYGDIEHRPIFGEATTDEARALIDEGIEVTPLPVLPEDRN
ncbi:hypothetical protein HNR60_002393 [Rhodopseudomonas rhenobacensis]|uniref:Putative regulatory protein FmdB zinc ribbon domain-containing protein n=1 Tax=Rhodopseudomonas rhenobacensis TaxID=87461 RepID=A0A7W7Z438_9BRAD|nr:DUF1178 family protein [Rhodopseudomonas rhenobacensis]MBB5047636.1 hypothetical protein [Rhodopseudomonas rhenobacensis]